MRRSLPALAAALLASALPLAALADMQPGQYKTTVTSDLQGDKQETQTHCVTQKDVDSGLSEMGIAKGDECKVVDFKKTSSSMSYRVQCPGGVGEQRVAATFSNDSFDMKMQFQLDPKGKPNTIHMVGKRIGACQGK